MLRVTTLHGMSSTYLEAVAEALLPQSGSTVGVLYRRTGDADAQVECVISDRWGTQETIPITMGHDCLSCLVREHTYDTLRRLGEHDQWQHALVTFPPGVDPSAFTQIVEYFQIEDEAAFKIVIDTCAVVADIMLVETQVTSSALLREWGLSVVSTDERTMGEVAARQIEFADVVLLANGERASGARARRSADLIRHLSPAARIIPVDRDSVPASTCVGLGLFDSEDPKRLNPLTSQYCPTPIAGEITTTTWTARRPMHPARFAEVVDEYMQDVIRGRGQLWLATSPTHQVGWESAGDSCSLALLDEWADVATGAESHLVLVGRDIDFALMTRALDGCLLSPEEMAEDIAAWSTYENPFARILDITHEDEDPS